MVYWCNFFFCIKINQSNLTFLSTFSSNLSFPWLPLPSAPCTPQFLQSSETTTFPAICISTVLPTQFCLYFYSSISAFTFTRPSLPPPLPPHVHLACIPVSHSSTLIACILYISPHCLPASPSPVSPSLHTVLFGFTLSFLMQPCPLSLSAFLIFPQTIIPSCPVLPFSTLHISKIFFLLFL